MSRITYAILVDDQIDEEVVQFFSLQVSAPILHIRTIQLPYITLKVANDPFDKRLAFYVVFSFIPRNYLISLVLQGSVKKM